MVKYSRSGMVAGPPVGNPLKSKVELQQSSIMKNPEASTATWAQESSGWKEQFLSNAR